MPQLSPCGASVISIDISGQQFDSPGGASLASASEALARLNDRQIVATLALESAADPNSLEKLGGALAGHELAILAHSGWYSVANRRGQFAHEISRHVQQAHAVGYRPTTLALPAGHLPEHLDLLVKHGISAVRTKRTSNVRHGWSWGLGRSDTSAAATQPQSLRWGLWEFGGALSLVEQGLRRATRAISRAAAEGALVQVVVELAPLASQGAAGWKQFDRLLEHLAQLRRQQAIEHLSYGAVAASLARTRQTPAAHSILRPAA